MAEPFPLKTVLDLMQVRADDAAKELGRLISAEQDAKNRLTLLEGYRDEYAARFREAAGKGLSARQWANFQEFASRIDLAIEQQTTAVNASSDRTQLGQQHWINQNQRVQAFDTLAQKHQAGERYREGKREQKQNDELSARKYRDKDPSA